jgi:2-polyprenyl-6-methoxyphenol hydroxylase-like FAD-dependent oxidoreductase
VENSAEGVTAHCTDGTSYEGDIIAGSDGVNSMTRQEMWRAADAAEPGKITEKEKKGNFSVCSLLLPSLI